MTTLTLTLPEPPAMNEMLALAKRTTRRGPGGTWMQKPQSLYWVRQQEYYLAALATVRSARTALPDATWLSWRIVRVEWRLHQLRDLVELNAGLKWPVDWLKHARIVADDSPRHLLDVAKPEQVVDRLHRGVTLTLTAA